MKFQKTEDFLIGVLGKTVLNLLKLREKERGGKNKRGDREEKGEELIQLVGKERGEP